MTISDRYASAVNATSLRPTGIRGRDEDRPQTVEVLASYGLADRTLTDGVDRQGKRTPPAPLAVPLARLLSGDSRAVHEIVRILAGMGFDHSYSLGEKVAIGECRRLAKATIAWFRHGRCTQCGGHGYERIPGVPALSGRACKHCQGGKIPFAESIRQDKAFGARLVPVAEWMRDTVEQSVGRAGPQALRHLSVKASLDLADGDRRM